MALQVYTGSFTSPNGTDSSFAVTGVGFTPALVIFLPLHRTTTGLESNTDFSLGVGAMTTSDQWFMGSGTVDAAATMSVDYANTDARCIVVLDGSRSSFEEASFVSMDSDGFTLNYSKSSSSQCYVLFTAFAGIDVDVGTMNIPTTAPPNTVNSPTLGFTPVGYLLAVDGQTTTNTIAAAGDGIFAIGGASSASEEFTASTYNEDGVARSDTGHGQDATNVIQQQDTGNSVEWEAEHSAMNSSTFTVNVVASAPAVTTRIGYIAFGGAVDCFMGDFNLNVSGTSQSVTVETGFQPDWMMFFGTDQNASGAGNVLELALGMSDGTNDQGFSYVKRDNGADAEPISYLSTTYSIFSDTSPTVGVPDEANISSFDTNGFTINHNVNPSVAFRMGYFAIRGIPTSSYLSLTRTRRMASHLAR